MSVLIKGMEMPKSCYDCPMMFERKSEILNTTYHDCPLLNIANFVDGYTSSRHPNCPIIELPPHGKLIDGDALERRFELLAGDDWNKSVGASRVIMDCAYIVGDAPTIIGAEDGA